MKIGIFKERENSRETIDFTGKSVLDLLRHLQINSETVLVVRKNEVLTEEELLEDQDRVDILSVISGG
ncbi:TPA: thiamine biosynthesis protein ThiS [Candidatus Woesearchaeota archaeon]|nr:thiamine biosynthesis protein ThiS [Candidatus Woesearchaeota archaeon]